MEQNKFTIKILNEIYLTFGSFILAFAGMQRPRRRTDTHSYIGDSYIYYLFTSVCDAYVRSSLINAMLSDEFTFKEIVPILNEWRVVCHTTWGQ